MMDWLDHIDMLPDHMQDGVIRYIQHGVPPGSFLTAVFSNDLKGAVARADYINLRRIVDYAQYMMWHMPSVCQGSPEKVAEWIEIGGLDGFRQKEEVE